MKHKKIIIILYSLIIIAILILISLNYKPYIIGIVTNVYDNGFTIYYITCNSTIAKPMSRGTEMTVSYENSYKLKKYCAVKIYRKYNHVIYESYPPHLTGASYVQMISQEQYQKELKKYPN